MSLFVLVKGPRIKSNRIWSTLTLCVAIYGFGAYMVSLAQDPRSALFWWQIAYIGIILIPVFFMHFTCASLGLKRPLLLKSLYIVSGILWILNILNGGFFLGKAALFFTGSKVFKPGYWVYPASPLLYFFIFIFVAVAIWSHQELTKGFQKSTGLKRNQLKYFLPASALAFAGGFTSFLPCFNIQLYPVFNIMVAIYPLIMGYAIIRYRLMDITVAVTRTGIFVAVYTLVLGIPFAVGFQCKDWLIRVFGANWWVAPSGLMAILATVGPFIYIYLQRKAEDRLLREQRRYHEVLKETGAGITRIRNLQKLLDLIVSIVTENVRLSHAAIYLYDSKTRQFCLRSGRNLKKDQPFSISRESAMITWLNHHREPLVYEEIKENTENGASAGFRKLKEQMSLLNAAVVLPSFLEEKLSNLLILGNKLSGRIYTSEDLSNFSILANATAVGIENALLYENIEEQVRQRTKELVETQKQLIQAEKLATVGTLAGGVAHEINNPLTAILTNIQMLLSGDEADELKADRESLELIEEATKRCRTIVQKLMTYAKKPLEVAEFSELNVLNAVKNVVTFLGYQLEQDNVKIIVKAKETDYPVIGNQNELEQVITNIILNARDAIRQAKKSGDITISLADSTDAIKIEIRDEGVGIAKDIMPKIFDPFFTTKDVGKGVGLGLSICQSIVEKHSGTITAQSEPHKGSVFTVTLPKAGRQ